MAPRPDLMTDLGWELLETLPPVLRGDPDMRAIIHCQAKEAERVEGAIEFVRAQANPLTAGDVGLMWWAALLRVPSIGVPEAELRTAVINRIRAYEVDPAGAAWVTRVSKRIGTEAWSYEENEPDPQTIRVFLPYAPGSLAFQNARRAIEEETPSEQELVFVSSGGFILDQSQMDVEGLGI